tara:strand:+ start:7666 stop:8025 length:360 start_codon:yes stop_codon:yes gene_type:complete
MAFDNPFFLVLSLCGIVYILAGFIMLKRPPKKINPLYGYRTRQSMSSQEKWDFAQIYSSKEMIRQGIYMIFIATLSLFISLNNMLSMMLALLVIILSVIFLLISTEKKLKQKFDSDETI